MNKKQSLRLAVLAAFAIGPLWMLAGCGSGDSEASVAKPLSAENEAKTKAMLKDYGKRMADQAKARRYGGRP
jgi:hypothetical protein